MKRLGLLSACVSAAIGAAAAAASGKADGGDQTTARRLKGRSSSSSDDVDEAVHLYIFCDIGDDQIGLINTRTDRLIQISFDEIAGWPFSGSPVMAYSQHAAIDPLNPRNFFISTVAKRAGSSYSPGDDIPAAMITLEYDCIDWEEEEVSGLRVVGTVVYATAKEESELFVALQGIEPGPDQPIYDWTAPRYPQLHGPSFRAGFPDHIYWGTWTDSPLIVINTDDGTMTGNEYGSALRYAHGYFFNPCGTIAIGTAYWFEGMLGLFRFKNKANALPTSAEPLILSDGRDRKLGGNCGAYVHYATWLDNRFAYVATMQQGSTSLSNCYVTGPGVYLVDAKLKTTERVAGSAEDKFGAGVWNSGSDGIIANNKLYVSEERTLSESFPFPPIDNSIGSVAIFDILPNKKLQFIKRIYPGSNGMPGDFGAGHGSSVAIVDGKEYVFVGSYTSNHIIKIDTEVDTVVKVWSGGNPPLGDGLSAPHGGFVAGSSR